MRMPQIPKYHAGLQMTTDPVDELDSTHLLTPQNGGVANLNPSDREKQDVACKKISAGPVIFIGNSPCGEDSRASAQPPAISPSSDTRSAEGAAAEITIVHNSDR